MASNDAVEGNAIFYAELLAAKVVEGVDGFPAVGEPERRAMFELVAVRLLALANAPEADRASG